MAMVSVAAYGVELDGVHLYAVDVGGDAEVEVLLGTGGFLAFFGWSIILVGACRFGLRRTQWPTASHRKERYSNKGS